MNAPRIISPKEGYATLLLREEYLFLCGAKHCPAMVLSQHEYWHRNRLANRQQARAHNAAATREGMPADQDTGLWVYRSHREMQDELLGLFGERAIAAAYAFLIASGYLRTRPNPRYKWDRKPQYLFAVGAVQAGLDGLPSHRDMGNDDLAESAETSPHNCGVDGSKMAEMTALNCGVSSETPTLETPERDQYHHSPAPSQGNGSKTASEIASQATSRTQPLGGSVKIASRTQTQTAAAPPPPDVLLSQADPEDGVTFEAMLLSDPEPEPEPSPDSRLAMTAGRREVGRTTPPATLPSQQKTVDQRPAAPRPVAPASSVALGVFEEAYDPNNFVLTSPPLGGRENAKAPAPRVANVPRAAKAPVAPKPPPGPTATAQFLDVFARRGIPPPRLLPRHHNNLKAYRQQVGDLFVQAVEDFTQTRWVIEKGYEACFLMGKTPEFWAASSGRFIPAPATLWVTVPGAAAPPPHRDAHFVTYYTPTERWQYRMEGGVGPNGETEHDDAAAMAALPAAYRERMLAGMARRKAARLEREAAAAAPD